IARRLGLTRRRTADWRAAREITDALARFDPDDPVRFDYALCRIGILDICRPRPSECLCDDCPVQSACAIGRRRAARPAAPARRRRAPGGAGRARRARGGRPVTTRSLLTVTFAVALVAAGTVWIKSLVPPESPSGSLQFLSAAPELPIYDEAGARTDLAKEKG